MDKDILRILNESNEGYTRPSLGDVPLDAYPPLTATFMRRGGKEILEEYLTSFDKDGNVKTVDLVFNGSKIAEIVYEDGNDSDSEDHVEEIIIVDKNEFNRVFDMLLSEVLV